MQAEPPFAQRESPPSLGSAITRRQAGFTALDSTALVCYNAKKDTAGYHAAVAAPLGL